MDLQDRDIISNCYLRFSIQAAIAMLLLLHNLCLQIHSHSLASQSREKRFDKETVGEMNEANLSKSLYSKK